jgi:hypothetical protein
MSLWEESCSILTLLRTPNGDGVGSSPPKDLDLGSLSREGGRFGESLGWLFHLASMVGSPSFPSFSSVRIGALEIYFAFPAGNRTCQWRESPSCSISNEWEEACISLSPIETGPEPSTKISPSSSVAIITPQASIPASSQSQCHPLCQDKNQKSPGDCSKRASCQVR